MLTDIRGKAMFDRFSREANSGKLGELGVFITPALLKSYERGSLLPFHFQLRCFVQVCRLWLTEGLLLGEKALTGAFALGFLTSISDSPSCRFFIMNDCGKRSVKRTHYHIS